MAQPNKIKIPLMFNRTIDEAMYKSQVDDMMFQLQRYMKVNPLKQLIQEKEKVLLTRKSVALEKVRHLQGLLAWSCNGGSTAESIKILNGEEVEDDKADEQCRPGGVFRLSRRQFDPCPEIKSKKQILMERHCSPLRPDKSQPTRNRVMRMINESPSISNCDLRINQRSVEDLKAQSTKKLQCVEQESTAFSREPQHQEGFERAEVVASKKPILNQRIFRKSSILPILDPKGSPSKQSPLLNPTLNRRNTNPSVVRSNPSPKIPRGYLRFDTACNTLLNANLPLLIGVKHEKCKDLKLPHLTAQRICVIDSESLEIILSRSPDDNQDPIEIASLTKILTCLLTILVCLKFNIDMKLYKCRVSEEAAEMPGTSADLQVGDILTIESLLYALMLPSGNDASVALAENIGRIILKNRKKPTKLSPYKLFVSHMNLLYHEVIKEANLPSETFGDSEDDEPCHRFQNPSGLSLYKNITKPEQIMLLAAVAHRNNTFRQIVSTREYSVAIRNERYGLQRRTNWRNTNKLLWRGWEGIKTGTTDNAGPCLIGKMENYLIGVFNCGGHQKRFHDASTIYDFLKKTL